MEKSDKAFYKKSTFKAWAALLFGNILHLNVRLLS
jgi:hypothetical protein